MSATDSVMKPSGSGVERSTLGRVVRRFRESWFEDAESALALRSLSVVSELDVDVRSEERLSDGDHDRYAHICRKEDITRAYVTGEAIEALCGKKWVPSRDPDKYPVCPACKEALASMNNSGTN